MDERVAIIGAGYIPFRAANPSVSCPEMIFKAEVKGCNDAGISPNHISISAPFRSMTYMSVLNASVPLGRRAAETLAIFGGSDCALGS